MSDDVKVKSFQVEIKDDSTGEVEAIIATTDVVDRDFEVITKGAINSGAKVKMSSYGHDIVGFMAAGELPVGKGIVVEENDKLVFRGKIFTSTERGRETLSVLKEMGKEQEWSFGFRVLGSELPDEDWRKKGAQRMLTKLDVFEVSPVVVGAGIGTRTLAAKAADQEAMREQAIRAKAEEEAATTERITSIVKAVLAAEKQAAAVQAAEERVAAETKAAEEKALADALAAEIKAAEEAETARLAAEAEGKRLAEEAAQKARTQEALDYHERVQRQLSQVLG